MRCFQLILLTLCVVAVMAQQSPGICCTKCWLCTKYQTRPTYRRVCAKYATQSYKVKCGFWNLKRCTRTRRVCSSYKTVTGRSRMCVQRQLRSGCKC